MLLAYVTDYVGWKFNEHGAGQNKFFAIKNLQRKDIFLFCDFGYFFLFYCLRSLNSLINISLKVLSARSSLRIFTGGTTPFKFEINSL